MGLRSYFVMKELKGDMQTLLNLEDYGYENSDSGETIRSCKSDQRGYDITNHSGVYVIQFYQGLLGRYRNALNTEISRLESEKSSVDRKCVKKSDASARWALGSIGGGGLALLGASLVVPGAALVGAALAATGAIASGVAEDDEKALRQRSSNYQSKINKAKEYLKKIKEIENSYELS